MMEKIMVVAPTTARADEHRLCGGLEGVACAVVGFSISLARSS